MKAKANVGSYDVAARFVTGCLLMILANHSSIWWGALGTILVLSAVFRFCLVYSVFHIDTTACDDHDAP
jgi:hypothetical protein